MSSFMDLVSWPLTASEAFVNISFIIGVFSIFSTFIVWKNERRRSMRLIFRKAVKASLHQPTEFYERELATAILSVLNKSNDISSLQNTNIDPLLRDYIADIMFKRNLYNEIYKKIVLDRIKLNASDISAINDTLLEWKNKNTTLENDIHNIIFSHTDHNSARRVEKFINSRKNYFDQKKSIFVDDIVDVVNKIALTTTLIDNARH